MNIFRLTATVVVLLLKTEIFAQTTYYSRNGATVPRNWDEADSWTLNSDGSGSAAAIPGRTDNVVILSGHDIIVDDAGDNGATGVSADDLGELNVGSFSGSGTINFYHTGNIYVQEGGIFTTSRAMLGGVSTVYGTLDTNSDLIITGKLNIAGDAICSVGEDFILSASSETRIYNTTTLVGDLYIDHTDAQLCGNNTIQLSGTIQYVNGASTDQICSNLRITGCGSCPVTGSGPNTLSIVQNLIPIGATWRYLDDGSDQGTAWTDVSFDDSSWAAGRAEFGYGDGDEITTISYGSNASNKYTTTYFRTSYYVEDRTAFTKITAYVKYDDGVVVYINGAEVIRDNMPGGTITNSTFASGTIADEDGYKTFNLMNTVVIDGTNYIAVEIHQSSLTSSDVSFDMELKGDFTNSLISGGEMWSYLDDGSDQGTAWTGSSFDDSSWGTGYAELGYGDGDETTTVSYGSDSNNKYMTTYFRKSFSNSDPSVYALNIGLKRDDGAVVYLNGSEILRDNMPSGTITYTTPASSAGSVIDEITYFTFEVDPSDLIVGTNYLAVEVHQANAASSDISFDLTLELIQTSSLLPVSLIDFKGEVQNDHIALSWSTASEINNDFFLVERSSDGLNFSTLAMVTGFGNSNEIINYALLDKSPHSGINYYRLTQFDFDGQSEVLKIIRVATSLPDVFTLKIFPNPASSHISILQEDGIAPESISLHDLAGAMQKVPMQSESGLTSLDLSGIKAGAYIIRIQLGEAAYSQLIFKD